jgi:hypothetical protein
VSAGFVPDAEQRPDRHHREYEKDHGADNPKHGGHDREHLHAHLDPLLTTLRPSHMAVFAISLASMLLSANNNRVNSAN